MRSKVFTGSGEPVFNAVTNALAKLALRVVSEDKKLGRIRASAATSFLSWGNDIEIEIISVVWHESTISVKSKSKSIQLITYGSNDDIEVKIINEIIKELYKHETFCME